ncbi:hypothetical protein [Clostridium thermarum]|uniref:hypothetical protein n=1 Tax=Clostridium thermarum TaxID=1716543 RepID=UPI0013D50807|nr:hypothetical protein [Clostridium thermarum]
MKTKNVQMSESYLAGMLLAVVGGFLDAYTYILEAIYLRGAVLDSPIALFNIFGASMQMSQKKGTF